MANKQLFIVRHGETEFNRLNIVQGSGVNTSLNQTGVKQANSFYQAYKNQPFDVVFTSALNRSIESVQGFIADGIPHIALPELNEISWGEFEGKQQTEEQKQIYWNLINQWNTGNTNAKINQGESPIELQNRQKKALNLIVNHHAQSILICMHGRAMKSFLCLLLNKPLTQMEEFPHTNLCLYKLILNQGVFSLVEANNTKHLI